MHVYVSKVRLSKTAVSKGDDTNRRDDVPKQCGDCKTAVSVLWSRERCQQMKATA